MINRYVLLLALLLTNGFLAIGQGIRLEPYEPGEGLTLSQGGSSLRFTGFMQPMLESRTYLNSGNDTVYNRFRMRRMVTRLTGEFAKYDLTYQIQLDLTGSSDGGGDATTNNYLMDAWVQWQVNKNVAIKFGQDNPVTDPREMSMRSNALQMVDRSPVSLTFSSIREFGVFLETKYRVGRTFFIAPTFAITNGDGANVFTNDRGGLKYGGRIDFIPFGNFNNAGQYREADLEYEMTPKLVVGINASYNNGISDRRGRQSGTIVYQDDAGNDKLPDYQKIGADFVFKYRGFSLLGEIVNAKAIVPNGITRRVTNSGTLSSTFVSNGDSNVANYVRSRIIAGSGINIQGGYMFKKGYSIDVRYSVLMPEASSFMRNPTYYNRVKYFTLCVSKYLGRNYGAKIQLSATYSKALPGSLTLAGSPLKGNEVTANIMLTIAL